MRVLMMSVNYLLILFLLAACQKGFNTSSQSAASTTSQLAAASADSSSDSTSEVNVKNYGAKGDSGTDDTLALQAALNAGAGKSVYLPAGVYFVTATLYTRGNTRIHGDGPNSTFIYRTGDYGDTLVVGSASDRTNAAWATQIRDMAFMHGQLSWQLFTEGQTALLNRATHGAHIQLYGAQGATLDNVWFSRMPYQVIFNGGSMSIVNDCLFTSIHDSLVPALQEGINELYFHVDPVYGNPVSNTMTSNKFDGAKRSRSVVLSDNSGRTISTASTYVDLIGPDNLVYIEGLEDGIFSENFFGGAAQNALFVANVANSAVLDLRITGNMFDESQNHITIAPQAAGTSALNVIISENVFNGEGDSAHAISILTNQIDQSISTRNLVISSNTFNHFYAAPIRITGADGFSVTGNTMTLWNLLGVSLTDAQFIAPLWIAGQSANGNVTGNTFDGANSSYRNTTVTVDSSTSNIAVGVQTYSGVQ